jgi:hypothetical protein
MIVIHNKWTRVSAYNAFFYRGLNIQQIEIKNYIPKFTAIYAAPIRGTTFPTPTVKPIPLFVMRGKIFRRCRSSCVAPCASQQFHAFNDNAFRVGRPFSSFIGPGIPDILAQNDFRRAASFFVLGLGAGGFKPGLPGFARL